ncbi:MAG TPA: carboxypeptidase regulatory-like domain-containing protein, partial [Ferruginibacter sp.]|nr:carboxypeptidase regulatory-like domain-containing protein [Ferruginibacter sp.]
MKCIFCFLLLSFLHTDTFAQSNTGIITGTVADKETRPLNGATLSLVAMQNLHTISTIVSDRQGNFSFENIPFGYYGITIKMVGYAVLRIDSIHIRAERIDFNLGDIKLTASVTQMEEVIVYTEKPLFENKDGKITFNASESALSNSATTTELLKQTPLVSVDTDGKILMRGKEVKILIDDKPVEMDSRQLQDLLESMPGSMIEKIEVLTTPPPQYANERGGVINIVTKKGRVGINSRVNINYGTRGEGGGNASFSYRKNKVAVNFNAGYSFNRYHSSSYSTRQNFYTDSSNFFKTSGNSSSKNKRPNSRFAFD